MQRVAVIITRRRQTQLAVLSQLELHFDPRKLTDPRVGAAQLSKWLERLRDLACGSQDDYRLSRVGLVSGEPVCEQRPDQLGEAVTIMVQWLCSFGEDGQPVPISDPG